MKKVKYSTAALQNPMRPDEDKKFYAVLQTTGTITTDELIEHISEHGSNFSEGTIAGVLRDIVSCVQEHILQGFIVELAPLGKFYPSCSSEGTNTDAEFTASDIKTFRANFRPNGKLSPDVLRQKVQFEKSVSVKAQKALESAINAGTLTLNSDGELVSGEGGEGNTGGGGSNNGVSGD